MALFQKMLFTFLASLVPAVEVKGAIPFGVALGLPVVAAYGIAILGSTIVVIFLAFVTNWFYNLCKRKNLFRRFIGWIERITEKNHEKIEKWGPLAILVYVAVPIPGTGTWTGSIIAGVINLKPKMIILSVLCGNLISGLIMSLASKGVFTVIERFVMSNQ